YEQLRVFVSLTKKIFMESPTAKRPKMSDHKINEPVKTSSDTKEIGKPDPSYSAYDYHYNQPFYVDKTLLIKELFEIKHVLITAPSRFGKTLNMDMVRRFVEIELDEDGKPIELDVDEDKRCLKEIQPRSKNFKLFQGKNISKEKKIMFEHFGKYPTIYVDFAGVRGNNFEEILGDLRRIIRTTFEKHDYLLTTDLWNREEFNKEDFMDYIGHNKSESLSLKQIKSGLVFLSEILHSYYGRKVFVFIDEFDAPVSTIIYENKMTPEDRRKTIELFQSITGNLLKDNDQFIERSLSNACQQLGNVLLGSTNNVEHCGFMQAHIFSKFYGFEEAE
ncbi:hypothetical protein PV325_013903, partial [Microctonus aethiopoides]